MWGHKNKYFFGYAAKLKMAVFRGHFWHFRSFLKIKVQNRVYLLGLLKFQIFFGVLEILDIFFFFFGGGGRN